VLTFKYGQHLKALFMSQEAFKSGGGMRFHMNCRSGRDERNLQDVEELWSEKIRGF
jgi:hypothetical protein